MLLRAALSTKLSYHEAPRWEEKNDACRSPETEIDHATGPACFPGEGSGRGSMRFFFFCSQRLKADKAEAGQE